MSAYFLALSEQSRRAVAARTAWAMARHSDQSEAATRIMRDQAARLRRLRDQIETIGEAADHAGISRDAWGRMERGESKIDPVALARWLGHHRMSPSYVILGDLNGLPGTLARELVQLELGEAVSAEDSEAAPTAGPSRRRRKRSSPGIARPPVPAA